MLYRLSYASRWKQALRAQYFPDPFLIVRDNYLSYHKGISRATGCPRPPSQQSAYLGASVADLLWRVCIGVGDNRNLSYRSRPWTGLASRDNVVDTHDSGRCINTGVGYASTIFFLNTPSYSGAAVPFDQSGKSLHLSDVYCRLRRIDSEMKRRLLSTLGRRQH
jgi:hypothetical protein